MIKIENKSREEIKEKYNTNHGFAFISSSPVADQSIERLVGVLMKTEVAPQPPILISRIDNAIVFVYEEMDTPKFFQMATHFEQMFRVAKVVPLFHYLNA